MVEDNLELLLKYPLISCTSEGESKRYAGRVLCGSYDINLEILEKNTDNGSFNLKTISGNTVDTDIFNINCLNITEFVDKVVAVLQKNASPQNILANIYRKILQQYSEFTGFYLGLKKCRLSTDLTKVVATMVDDGGRDHVLEILADLTKTKNIFSPINLNLPEKLTTHLTIHFSSLSEIYSKFNAIVQSLQLFFEVMDDLDHNCCILDPEQPTRRECYRRIWLDQCLSVMVTVDPLNAKARPELKFLGPECVVDQFLERLRLSAKLEDWDQNTQLCQGLLNVLGLEIFPAKPTNEKVVLTGVGECSICFVLRLHDKLPQIICETKYCGNFYHVECLYEWLTSVNSKRIFNKLHGQCPNCEKKITCPLPETELA